MVERTLTELDALIRKKAAETAADELRKLTNKYLQDVMALGYERTFQAGTFYPAKKIFPTDQSKSFRGILEALEDTILPAIQEYRGQQAAEQFIQKVDDLQNQIEDFQSQVS